MDWWDDELCARLAGGGRRVVRYDHRDTGRSTTWPPGAPAYDGDRLTRDCADLVGSLGAGPVHLVGLSMGGGIAQTVALRRPELVASLTLVSTAAVGGVDWSLLPGPSPEVEAYFAAPPATPDWADAEAYADWVVATERVFAGRAGVDVPRLRALAAHVHARSTDVAAAGNHWLVVDDDGEGDGDDDRLDVADLGVPTLVVHGDVDPLFPQPHAEALARAIPGAELLVLPGTGHQVPPPATWDLLVPALLRHTAG